ncbi:MAG: M14 family zinc carboxypeptidase [Verrucomicrobiota bacterium]
MPHTRIEVIGKTVQGRDLQLVTVTNFDQPDAGKKTVWLQARQHAWEAGTSHVMEGALLFATSDDPLARQLREKVVFQFVPMMDPDGCANGQVRFNANGYDVNRHWNEVDLRRKEWLQRMPEIWYVKKALLGCVDSGRKIDLMLNLHNTESAEFMDTQAGDEPVLARFRQFESNLMERTTFDPTQKVAVRNAPGNTTNSLYEKRQIPVLLMEQRIGFSQKLGRDPTAGDRLDFGRQLIAAMAETVLAKE